MRTFPAFKQAALTAALVASLAFSAGAAANLPLVVPGRCLVHGPDGAERDLHAGLPGQHLRNAGRLRRRADAAAGRKLGKPRAHKWIFKLRKGVKFHDGSPFTADDVIFTWKRSLTPGSDMKGYGAKAADIKKIDDYTVEVTTPAPNPILPREWAFLYIMSKTWSEEQDHRGHQHQGRQPGQLRQPARQRHRPLHAGRAPARREDRAQAL